MWSLRTLIVYYLTKLVFFRQKRTSQQKFIDGIPKIYVAENSPERIPSFLLNDGRIKTSEGSFKSERSINTWQILTCRPSSPSSKASTGAGGKGKVMIHYHGGAFVRAVSRGVSRALDFPACSGMALVPCLYRNTRSLRDLDKPQ